MSFQSFSVPTSPAMTRSSKNQPVTPQRISRHQHRHSQSFYKSPLTSSSPFTPLSHRSTDSAGSSTLTTPDNVGLNIKKRLSFSVESPEVTRSGSVSTQDKSLADIAENWRCRASENGIKVSSANSIHDSSHYGDDEASEHLSDANDSGFITAEEVLLPSHFLSKQRINGNVTTRPRAQSHVPLPTSRNLFSPTVPKNNNRTAQAMSPIRNRQQNSSFSQPANLMATPPPNRSLATQLKLKGSFTDPAHTRRREAFGVRTPAQNMNLRNSSLNMSINHDTSLDLFDIDENDYEYDFQQHEVQDDSFSLSLHAHNANSNGYPLYPHQIYRTFPNQPQFSDPFQPQGVGMNMGGEHVLTSIAESVEQHFHATQQQNNYCPETNVPSQGYFPYRHRLPPPPGIPHLYAKPIYTPVPIPPAVMATSVKVNNGAEKSSLSFSNQSMNKSINSSASASLSFNQIEPPSECSVCLAVQPPTLAILKPCGHPLCSSCLTSALNIVGEKDMECAVCKQSVADFKLIVPSGKTDKSIEKPSENLDLLGGRSFFDPLFSSPGSSSALSNDNGGSDSPGELESAFEFGLDFGELRASTPKLEQEQEKVLPNARRKSGGRGCHDGDCHVVLRIDNVPWDITPQQIKKWVQQPVVRVHVLLDSKGKTMSHAYVEVDDAGTAGAILRGEALVPPGAPRKERGSVLGRGRRARGVTVTRSGQEELMADLFPNWRGTFDGSRPSLAGLEGTRIASALERGLLTEGEVSGLLHLIREPDSHFLKVPSLPFHSLVSILRKFPADIDSRVFWSAGVRDLLYDVSFSAVQVLLSRVEKTQQLPASSNREEEYTMDLATDLMQAAIDCRAFTSQQVQILLQFSKGHAIALQQHVDDDFNHWSDSGSEPPSRAPRTPASRDQGSRSQGNEPFENIAREFGVEAHLVEALAHRLARLS